MLKRNPLYRKLAFILLSIKSFEVVLEMISLKKWGKKVQERTVLTIEIVKFDWLIRLVIRILMMKSSGKKMILHAEMPERSFDLAKLAPHDPDGPQTWTGKRTGKEFLPVDALAEADGSFEKSLEYLLSKAMMEPSANPQDLTSGLTGLREFGEYLYLFRPVVYGIYC
jgi:hypothetical protein